LDTKIPVAEERLAVDTRRVLTGQVRVETRTETVEEIAEAELETTEVDVVRVQIGREVDVAPEIRTDGDVTIISVVEERIVVSRRLILKEEIHVSRRRTVETVQIPVSLRRQQAIVTRTKPEEQDNG
jgi:stress response protein YsnF